MTSPTLAKLKAERPGFMRRFDLSGDYDAHIAPIEDGDYALYSDAEKLLSAIAALDAQHEADAAALDEADEALIHTFQTAIELDNDAEVLLEGLQSDGHTVAHTATLLFKPEIVAVYDAALARQAARRKEKETR